MKSSVKKNLDFKMIYKYPTYYLLYQNQGIDMKKIYVINPRQGTYFECPTVLIPGDVIKYIKTLW